MEERLLMVSMMQGKNISMLTTTVQLTGAADYELQMVMHTSTSNTDISLSREFQIFF